MTRVLVCGGRDFDQWESIARALDSLNDEYAISLIIQGGAKGADLLAERWAFHRNKPVCTFPANWRFDGRSAGPIRNRYMLKFGEPDLIVAFPGGRGTHDMVVHAEESGFTVIKPMEPA